MAKFVKDACHTFNEYLLIPGYTSPDCTPNNVDLSTPLTKFSSGEKPIKLNIPFVSAIMQSVSNDTLAIALAKEGGMSFIYGSQSIEDEAKMVAKVKNYKAGFVVSASNLTPDSTLKDVVELKEKNGFSTIAITDDGTSSGKLLGIVTGRDYRVSRMELTTPVKDFMTPFNKLVTAKKGVTLKEANDIIWDHKLNSLPIIDD
ncbi:MAG: IMP dehydrogenase, partial [Clostridia bacterium]|nr:IMP dehydrogenase [Clostridia bacterium]